MTLSSLYNHRPEGAFKTDRGIGMNALEYAASQNIGRERLKTELVPTWGIGEALDPNPASVR